MKKQKGISLILLIFLIIFLIGILCTVMIFINKKNDDKSITKEDKGNSSENIASSNNFDEIKDKDLKKLMEYCLNKEESEFIKDNKFINNEILKDAENDIKFLFDDEYCTKDLIRYENIYIKYNNKAYKIVCIMDKTKDVSVDNDYIASNIELIYEPKGKEGKNIKIDGEDWLILYDYGEDENGKTSVEAISPKALGELKIGKSYFDEPNDDKYINEYNNAVNLINEYCKEIITDETATDDNIRSIGSSKETEKYYDLSNSKFLKTNIQKNNKFKDSDDGFEQDFVRLCFFEKNKLKNDYWVSSRGVCIVPFNSNDHYIDIAEVVYTVGSVDKDGNWAPYNILWHNIRASKGHQPDDLSFMGATCGVLPIIKTSI